MIFIDRSTHTRVAAHYLYCKGFFYKFPLLDPAKMLLDRFASECERTTFVSGVIVVENKNRNIHHHSIPLDEVNKDKLVDLKTMRGLLESVENPVIYI